jgi:chromosome segregation ATPase
MLENELSERDRLVEILEASNATFRAQISERDRLVEEYRAEKQKLTIEIEERDALIEDFKDEKEQFTSELARRTAELETLQQQLCTIMKDNSRSLTALQATRKGEHEELSQIRKQLSGARHNIAFLQNENETLSAAFREKEEELIRIKSLNEGQIEEEKFAHKQAIDDLRSEIESKQAMIVKLRSQLREQASENRQQAAILDTVERQCVGLSREFAEQGESASTRAELSRLKQENEQLRETYSLLSSRDTCNVTEDQIRVSPKRSPATRSSRLCQADGNRVNGVSAKDDCYE